MSSDFKNLFIPVNRPSGLFISIAQPHTHDHSRSGPSLDSRCTVKHNDSVRKIRGHDEIVLDNKCRTFRTHDKLLDDFTGNDTLLGIEVRRGFVDKEDVGWDTEHEDNSNSLQLTTGQAEVSEARTRQAYVWTSWSMMGSILRGLRTSELNCGSKCQRSSA